MLTSKTACPCKMTFTKMERTIHVHFRSLGVLPGISLLPTYTCSYGRSEAMEYLHNIGKGQDKASTSIVFFKGILNRDHAIQ